MEHIYFSYCRQIIYKWAIFQSHVKLPEGSFGGQGDLPGRTLPGDVSSFTVAVCHHDMCCLSLYISLPSSSLRQLYWRYQGVAIEMGEVIARHATASVKASV